MAIAPRRILSLVVRAAAALLLAALVAMIAGHVAERRARRDVQQGVAADARLRQALLTSEIERFQLLPMALGDDVDVRAALADTPGARVRLNAKFAAMARETGAAAIYLIAPSGVAIAANNAGTPYSFVGRDYRFRRYFGDATRTGTGSQFALGTVSQRPGLYLARRTRVGGVVVVKLEFDRLERAWRAAGGDTFVTDPDGVIRVTTRPGWRFAVTRPLSPARAQVVRADSGVATLRRSPISATRDGEPGIAGMSGPVVLAEAPAGAFGWQVHLAIPAGPTIRPVVRAAQAVAGVSCLALIALVWAWRTRARRRAERTALLETAVQERTAALRREIDDRIAVEARAADLREGLRQANRLAALGQITASVAHETAQPVAAIRTYAANGELLLDRGAWDDVRANLRAIAGLTDRIGAVTAQLRGFARKGSGAVRAVPLADVIAGARLMLKERLRAIDVRVTPIDPALAVMAGRIRLEQVLVNLLQNAIEALEGRPAPRIDMAVVADDDTVTVTVRDNGPGIAPEIADRLFTPFATSRPAGLGLGLVITQDIMADLGGSLHVAAGEAGAGAMFVVTLRRAA